MGGIGMPVGLGRMFVTLGVITLPVLLCRGPVALRSRVVRFQQPSYDFVAASVFLLNSVRLMKGGAA